MKRYQNDRDASLKQSWWKGTLAGSMGAIPMTFFMLATQRFLPEGQRYDVPPEIITKELTSRAHVRWRMNKTQIFITTLIAHLSYSAPPAWYVGKRSEGAFEAESHDDCCPYCMGIGNRSNSRCSHA